MKQTILCSIILGTLVALPVHLAVAGAAGPSGTGTTTSMPEPASLALLGAGVAGIFAIRRRSRRK